MNILQLKGTLNRKFRGANIDDVQGISDYTLFEEAGNNLISRIDPYETVRKSEINLYDDVYDYASPSDLKGKKILDIRPQGERNTTDFRQTFTEDFDRDKAYENEWFSVEFDEGTKLLRVNKSVSHALTLTDLESTSYTATSGVSNIAEDTVLFHDSGKSLRFDVASGSNVLTWDGTAVDMSTHTNKSSFFLWVYFPDSSIITSLTLRVGSSSANYHEMTGQIHFGAIRTGWNLYRFDWNGATETGTVDETVTDYARFALVTTSADTDIRIGKLTSKLPSPHEIVYYSNGIYRPASGTTWLSKPTADTDIINLETEAQNILLYECAHIIASDLQYEAEMEKYAVLLEELYGEYTKDKPSEAIRPTSRYYTPPRRNRYHTWK